MTLEDLLGYKDIVIQCHDDPDADAIASGYALLKYLESKGKSPRLVYSGGRKVTKKNLLLMIEKLNVPLEYVRRTDDEAELLVMVDCRAGQRNVSALPHQTIAVIDHHELDMGEVLPKLCEVRTDCNACVTVIWLMLKKAGFPIEDRLLSTALYYGLYMDTQKFKGAEELDREMLDALRFDWDIVLLLQSADLTLDDFRTAGSAFMNLRYHPDYHFALAPVNTSEPYMLGIVSDMMMDVHELSVCVAYCLLERERCVKVSYTAGELIFQRLADYFRTPLRRLAPRAEKYEPARAEEFCKEKAVLYNKKKALVGFVRAMDLFPEGTEILLRTPGGDIIKKATPELYILIDAERKVSHITEEELRRNYELTDEEFPMDGELLWQPKVYHAGKKEAVPLTPHAKKCVAKNSPRIWAAQLNCRLEVLVWGDWHLGEVGDWLACQEDDHQNAYIIPKSTFEQSYERVE